MNKKRKRVSEDIMEEVNVVELTEEVKEVAEDIKIESKEIIEEVVEKIEEKVKKDKLAKGSVGEETFKEKRIETLSAEPKVTITDKIIDTEKVFGKCKVVVDETVVYDRSQFSRMSNQRKLVKGDTFYFDRMHTTTGNNIYVSWNGVNGRRNYTLYKDLTLGTSPVVRISH